MAQNVTIAGASYSDVPSVTIPKSGGGTAVFVDTSDANAVASDIALGMTAYVNGQKITGTGSGGGGGNYNVISVDNGDGTQDINITDVTGTITAGNTPVLMTSSNMCILTNKSAHVSTGLSLTFTRAGTYRIKWGMGLNGNSGTVVTSLYKNSVEVTPRYQCYSGSSGTWHSDLLLAENDVIELYATAADQNGSASGFTSGLVACVDWDNGF